ncbi:MAG: hypothetical protein LBC87_06110 [Fibromonadaceae bacterium]|jgi:hypothetical protein|nr:hypothetical protein [Fibromonadaceae bacterium]
MLNKIEKKKELSAYLIKNGERKIFTCSKPKKLSKYGIWRRENKNYGKILDMRAALK